jgi:murein DD-endopeptidase MepM/ murein hydrolase activator NlpD
MAKRFYTVLILSDATARAKKLHLSKPVVAAAGAGAGLLIVGLILLAFTAIGQRVSLAELHRFRQQASDARASLDKITALEKEVLRLRDFDQKLRAIAGLDRVAQAAQPTKGQGGLDEGSARAIEEAMQRDKGRALEKMFQDIAKMEQEIASRARSFRELKTFLENQRTRLAATPSIWPVKGWVTSGYGYRTSPFTGQRHFHEGLDISAKPGTPIVATADGVVTFAGVLGGFGNVVILTHGHGLTTFYGHNQKNLAAEGKRVRRGEVIATVGNTGYSTGPHLHYEVIVNGASVDPGRYIIEDALAQK